MKHLAKTLTAALLFCAACSSQTTRIEAVLSPPYDLVRAEPSYQVEMTLSDTLKGLIALGPVTLTLEPESGVWVSQAINLNDGDYEANVEIFADYPTGRLALAQAARTISLRKGSPLASIAFRPIDFDISFDEDADQVPNITEFSIGTSPVLPDTDGDGVFDVSDAFPLDASISVDPNAATATPEEL